MDVVQPCNAKKNGICWYWALQCPPKFSPFFCHFLPFFCQNGKIILFLWPDFLLLLLMPPHFIQAPLPPSIEKQVQKVHLRNQKRLLIKHFYIVKFKLLSWSPCKKKVIVKLENDFFFVRKNIFEIELFKKICRYVPNQKL